MFQLNGVDSTRTWSFNKAFYDFVYGKLKIVKLFGFNYFKTPIARTVDRYIERMNGRNIKSTTIAGGHHFLVLPSCYKKIYNGSRGEIQIGMSKTRV